MTWPPDIADELPEPREDEPVSLRQDIADELADHLASAFNRERHFTQEENVAQQKVLDRFGDPRRIARQLWFDAMKEKIMTQRVNLVLFSLMTFACLGALGLMSVMLRDNRDLNAAMLDKLQSLAAAQPTIQSAPAATPQSLDWVRLKFKLVASKKGGPPALGFKVNIQGVGTLVLGDAEKNGSFINGVVEEAADDDGIADLGLFRFGNYNVTVISPWGEYTSRLIGLRPGQELVREIVCPAAAPEEVDVAFSVDWPEDLRAQGLWVICKFGAGRRRFGADSWMNLHSSNLSNNFYNISLIINSDGLVVTREVEYGGIRPQQGASQSSRLGSAHFVMPSRFDETYRVRCPACNIVSLVVVKPDLQETSQNLPVLARMDRGAMGGTGMGGGGIESMGGRFVNSQDNSSAAAFHESEELAFEPKPGQRNHWTIRLPDKVLDEVRETLKSRRNVFETGDADTE